MSSVSAPLSDILSKVGASPDKVYDDMEGVDLCMKVFGRLCDATQTISDTIKECPYIQRTDALCKRTYTVPGCKGYKIHFVRGAMIEVKDEKMSVVTYEMMTVLSWLLLLCVVFQTHMWKQDPKTRQAFEDDFLLPAVHLFLISTEHAAQHIQLCAKTDKERRVIMAEVLINTWKIPEDLGQRYASRVVEIYSFFSQMIDTHAQSMKTWARMACPDPQFLLDMGLANLVHPGPNLICMKSASGVLADALKKHASLDAEAMQRWSQNKTFMSICHSIFAPEKMITLVAERAPIMGGALHMEKLNIKWQEEYGRQRKFYKQALDHIREQKQKTEELQKRLDADRNAAELIISVNKEKKAADKGDLRVSKEREKLAAANAEKLTLQERVRSMEDEREKEKGDKEKADANNARLEGEVADLKKQLEQALAAQISMEEKAKMQANMLTEKLTEKETALEEIKKAFAAEKALIADEKEKALAAEKALQALEEKEKERAWRIERITKAKAVNDPNYAVHALWMTSSFT